MEYKIVRSGRRTVGIEVNAKGEVIIRAPYKVTESEIAEIVEKHKGFIEKHQKERLEAAENAEKPLEYGDSAIYRGESYPIEAREGNEIGFDGKCFFFPPGLVSERLQTSLEKIYRILAKKLLTERTASWSEKMGLTPISVKINGAKTRWGSCSGKNSINFSWRLVLYPDDAIDAVVVHELAHIKEHNHGKAFWDLVYATYPEYKRSESLLRSMKSSFGG